MAIIEQQIKDVVRCKGVDVVGIAGPERLDRPPSLDLKDIARLPANPPASKSDG